MFFRVDFFLAVGEWITSSESPDSLPALHKDPFDRMLVAQATVEGIALLTADPWVAQYPGPIRRV